jgi:hypothetical protein
VVVGALLVGLVILDTTLVTYSRTRGHRPVFSGGRDHLTHRVVDRLGSPQAVAGTLALTQLLVCSVAIAVARAGVGWVLLAGVVCLAFSALLVWQFEHGGKFAIFRPKPPTVATEPTDGGGAEPATLPAATAQVGGGLVP